MFDFGKGMDLRFDGEFAAGSVGHDLLKSVREDVGCGNAGCAQNGEGGAAQGGGGKVDGRTSGFADLNQAGFLARSNEFRARQGGEERFRGTAPKIVDNDLEASLASRLAEGFSQILVRIGEVDGGIGAEFEKGGQCLLVASSGDDASGTQKLGNLYSKFSGDAGSAQDKDRFTRYELGAPGEGEPCGDTRIRESGCDIVRHGVEQGEALCPADDGTLGHGPVGATGSAEEDTSAVVEVTHAVDATDRGQIARASIVGARGHLPVDRLKRGCVNVDENFVCGRSRIGELRESRRFAQRVEDGSVHRSLAIRLQVAEEVEDGGVDVGGALLLGPVAATGEEGRAMKLGHPLGETGEDQVHAAEGDNQIAVASDIEGGHGDLLAGEWGQEFPAAIDVAVPVQAAAESRAGEFLHIKVDVGFGQPGWECRGIHQERKETTFSGNHADFGAGFIAFGRAGRIAGGGIQEAANTAANIALEFSLGDTGSLEVELVEERLIVLRHHAGGVEWKPRPKRDTEADDGAETVGA